jgi:alpha-tubulin suppressor-like RCC1 family protein
MDFPYKVKSESEVADIIAGPSRTGVIRQDGTVMLYATRGFSDNQIKPLEIEFFKDYQKIGIGDKHIIGIDDNQKVYSSGDSYWGQLGNGSQNHHNNFGDNFIVSVEVSDLEGIIDISTGKDHTIALKDDGTVWSWGVNLNGELGNGLTSHISLVPTQVLEVEDIVAISSSMYHILALKEDGTVWSWGKNSSGQLGNGTTAARVRVPVQVKNLENVVAIKAGRNHSMAIKEDGSVWVWGDNTFGQLGDGTYENKLLPVENEKLKGAKEVSGGGDFTIVLKEDGTLLSMGDNSFSTLGIGRTDIVTRPVKAY